MRLSLEQTFGGLGWGAAGVCFSWIAFLSCSGLRVLIDADWPWASGLFLDSLGIASSPFSSCPVLGSTFSPKSLSWRSVSGPWVTPPCGWVALPPQPWHLRKASCPHTHVSQPLPLPCPAINLRWFMCKICLCILDLPFENIVKVRWVFIRKAFSLPSYAGIGLATWTSGTQWNVVSTVSSDTVCFPSFRIKVTFFDNSDFFLL